MPLPKMAARITLIAAALAVAASLFLWLAPVPGQGNGFLDGPRRNGRVPQAELGHTAFLPLALKEAAPAPAPTPTPAQVAGCGSSATFFTSSPLALADVEQIVPLGNFNPPGHVFPTDHIYWYIKKADPNDPQSAPVEVLLFSPGTAWVTYMSAQEHLSATPPFTDYTLVLSPCKEIEFRFGHVTSLSTRLQDKLAPPFDSCNEYTTGGQQYRFCTKSFKQTELGVEAAEIIGTAGGRLGQNALDLWAWDFRTPPLPYVNPGRRFENMLHVVCPLDYFTSNVKSAVLAKIQRTVPPICGEVEQDEPGTAQGVWFVKGTTGSSPEDPHIALAHDNINPSIAAFSVGTSMAKSGLSSGVYSFNPAKSGKVNREFSEVTADGSTYCYEPPSYSGKPLLWTIVIQLTGPAELRVERQAATSCGSGPWSFGTTYTDFER